MRLPFTPAEFFAVFSAYNTAVWPLQLLLLALAAVVCLALVRHALDRLVLVILAVLWLWMGLVYHLRFFSAINPAARLFASFFCVAAAAFAWASLRSRGRAPRRGGVRSVAGWSLLAYALVGYPLLAHMAGQRYPALPTFGLPCPTTIFTLAVLLLLSPVPPRVLFVIPLLWSAVGTAAAVQLGGKGLSRRDPARLLGPVGREVPEPSLAQVGTLPRYSDGMGALRYSINVTLDGCCDHQAIPADEELHRHAAASLERADAILFGRVTYQMMEEAWRVPARTGVRPEWMAEWMEPFARTMDAAKKYVVSSTLAEVDWNAELVRGDLGEAVRRLKRHSDRGVFVAGVKLALALTELGLIDEYELIVHPRLAGHGPTLFAGLSKPVDLDLVGRLELGSGAVAMTYVPRK